MGEVIARGGHDKVDFAIRFETITLCHNRLEGGSSLFESHTGLCIVIAKLAKTKAKPEERVAI